MSLHKYCIFIIPYNNLAKSAKHLKVSAVFSIHTATGHTVCDRFRGSQSIQSLSGCEGQRQQGPLSAHPKGLSSFLGTGLSWGRRLTSARPIRGIPYLLDDSLLMMALTGRIEFRSFLCCSIRDDCADTERWEAGGLWISNVWPTAAWRKKENMKLSVIRTGMYLSKLGFNGIKLHLLMDCPGNIISFKWLWNTRNCCHSLNM